MPITLEQEAELIPLAEKAVDLIANLIVEEDSKSYDEFQKVIEKISSISPIVSRIYVRLYERVPEIKGRVLDYIKNNI